MEGLRDRCHCVRRLPTRCAQLGHGRRAKLHRRLVDLPTQPPRSRCALLLLVLALALGASAQRTPLDHFSVEVDGGGDGASNVLQVVSCPHSPHAAVDVPSPETHTPTAVQASFVAWASFTSWCARKRPSAPTSHHDVP